MIKKALPFLVLGSFYHTQVLAEDSTPKPLFHRIDTTVLAASEVTIDRDETIDTEQTQSVPTASVAEVVSTNDSSNTEVAIANGTPKIEVVATNNVSSAKVEITTNTANVDEVVATNDTAKAEVVASNDEPSIEVVNHNGEPSAEVADTNDTSKITVAEANVIEVAEVAAQPEKPHTDQKGSETLFHALDKKASAQAPQPVTATGHRNITSELINRRAANNTSKQGKTAVSQSRAVKRAVSYTVRGKRYTTLASSDGFVQTGRASWYGKQFHGRKTASGEVFDMNAMTAAHKELPLGSKIEVTNNTNGKKVVVTVNDRGPFHGNRILDLSKAAAQQLGVIQAGTADVTIRAL